MTCYNRKELTLQCLRGILDERLRLFFVIMDDGSSDGTFEALASFLQEQGLPFFLLRSKGNLYWAGGMRLAMRNLLDSGRCFDYVALVNDDVCFEDGALFRMIERSRDKDDMPVSGVVRGSDGNTSYGGVVYDRKRVKPTMLSLEDANRFPCDTANCNCLLLPWKAFQEAGPFDAHYVHAMADYDYGFTLQGLGYRIWLTDFFVGTCDDNPLSGSWRDRSLPRLERIRRKEAPKGLPFRQWFYYLRKNFGLSQALWHSITPYIRILLGI